MDTLRTKLDTAAASESSNPFRALADVAKRTFAMHSIRGFYGELLRLESAGVLKA